MLDELRTKPQPARPNASLEDLIQWVSRRSGVTVPEDISKALTGENLPYEDIPEVYWTAVRQFRKKNFQRRLTCVKRYIPSASVKPTAPADPPPAKEQKASYEMLWTGTMGNFNLFVRGRFRGQLTPFQNQLFHAKAINPLGFTDLGTHPFDIARKRVEDHILGTAKPRPAKMVLDLSVLSDQEFESIRDITDRYRLGDDYADLVIKRNGQAISYEANWLLKLLRQSWDQ